MAGAYADEASQAARDVSNGVPGSGGSLARFRATVDRFAHTMNNVGRSPVGKAAREGLGPLADLVFFGVEVNENYNGRYENLSDEIRMQESVLRATVTEGSSILVGTTVVTAGVASCPATAGAGCVVAVIGLGVSLAWIAARGTGWLFDEVRGHHDVPEPIVQYDPYEVLRWHFTWQGDSWERFDPRY
jgi:hypothetical protein